MLFKGRNAFPALPINTFTQVIFSLTNVVPPTIVAATERSRPAYINPTPSPYTDPNSTPIVSPTSTFTSTTVPIPSNNSQLITNSTLASQSLTNNSTWLLTAIPIPNSPPNQTRNFTPLWITLGIIITALLALIIIFIALLKHKRIRMRRKSIVVDEIAATASMEPNLEPPFLGGHKLNRPRESTPVIEAEAQKAGSEGEKKDEEHAPVSAGVRRTPGEDGRRFGVVVDLSPAGGLDRVDERAEVTGENGAENDDKRGDFGPRRRDTLDAWKRGVVPPLKGEDAVVGQGISDSGTGTSCSGHATLVNGDMANDENEKSPAIWI